jgi:DNA-binding PadR family transcriptional regulator
MTLPNEVKFKVRAIALDLETFTVADLARVTALNPSSIRTELQRMKRGGYLTSRPVREEKAGRGAPPHCYQLTDDVEKRLALTRSIEPFYGLPHPAPRPLSLHYQAALTLAERLEAGELSAAEREAILHDARQHLSLAAEEEGVDIRPEAETAVAVAHMGLLWARLAIAADEWDRAEPHLATARRTFADRGLDEMLAQVESLQAALAVERTLAQASTERSLPEQLLAVLKQVSGTLPLPTVRRILSLWQTVTASGGESSAIESLSRTVELLVGERLASASAQVVQTELRQEADEIAREEPARALAPGDAWGQSEEAPIPAPDWFRPPTPSQRDE